MAVSAEDVGHPQASDVWYRFSSPLLPSCCCQLSDRRVVPFLQRSVPPEGRGERHPALSDQNPTYRDCPRWDLPFFHYRDTGHPPFPFRKGEGHWSFQYIYRPCSR